MKRKSKKSKLASLSVLSCFAVLAIGPIQAGTKVDAKAVTIAPESSPWAFSAGAIVRSIDADFHLSPPRPLNFGGLLRSGGGDVGLFRTGNNRRTYDNGSVEDFSRFGAGGPPPGVIPIALAFGGSVHGTGTVSYTHLTLPTILRV